MHVNPKQSLFNFAFDGLDGRQKSAQCQSDDCNRTQPRVGAELAQNFQVGRVEPDSSNLLDLFQGSDPAVLEKHDEETATCNSYTNDIQAKPEISDSVTGTDLCCELPSIVAESASLKALPLDFLLGPKDRNSPTERILAQLIQSEAREVCPHLRDDYRQTFISISKFSKGEFETYWDAFVATSYAMYGLHPDKLFDKILARRAWMLGATNVVKFPPKKEAVSVSVPEKKVSEG